MNTPKDKWSSKRKKRLLVKMLLAKSDRKRADVMRKSGVFHHIGEKVEWHSVKLPAEPYLVSIHDNVIVAANVTLITHDPINSMLSKSKTFNPEGKKDKYYLFHIDKIEIFDNVFIGANVTINPGISIGPNAVIAAGSVVVKNVEPGTIVGGNPAKVIGSVAELAKKREKIQQDGGRVTHHSSGEEIEKFFWQ